MSRRYFLLPPRAEEALAAFRGKWAGRMPRSNPEWLEYDNDKQLAMSEALGADERKRLATDRNYQAEYRRFLGDLIQGEPQRRAVGPDVVGGAQAGIGQVDVHGYFDALAARAGAADGSTDQNGST